MFMMCCDSSDQTGRLRQYAMKWMEPRVDEELELPEVRPIASDAEFLEAFKKTMFRGFPVLKYGRGKIVKRNLQLDDKLTKLSWVGKKADRFMVLSQIQSIDRDLFADTPSDSHHLCLAFRVPVDGKKDVEKVLKIICFYEVDVHILIHGFHAVREQPSSEKNWFSFLKNFAA